MKLKALSVKNFKSIKEAGFNLEPFYCLVGENNAGKSNILECISLFLTDDNISYDHFYKNEEDVSNEMEIKITFNSLKEKEKTDFIDYIVNDELIIGKKYTVEENTIKKSVYVCVRNPTVDWLRLDYRNLKREIMEGYPIIEFLPESGRILIDDFKIARRKYIELHSNEIEWGEIQEIYESGLNIKISQILPNLYFMHAISDVSTEIRSSGRSMLSNILGIIVDKIARINPKFTELEKKLIEIKNLIEGSETDPKLEQISQLESLIDGELEKWGVSTTIKSNLPSASTIIKSSIYVKIDDGITTDPEEKGHGLQRSIIFALIRVWANMKNEIEREITEEGYSKHNIFVFEEPEIFLHPQMERATYNALKSISDSDQVILCTHSSNFIDMNDYMSIGLVKKNSIIEGTKVESIKRDIFDGNKKSLFNLARYFNHDRNEIFFAKKVLLAEGGCEKSVIPLLAKRIGVYDHGISIIDCMGKYNLTTFMEILNEFKIPYIVMHDEDPINEEYVKGGSQENETKYKESKKAFEENKNISSKCDGTCGRVILIKPNFEKFIGISSRQSEKLGKPYAAITKYSDIEQALPEELTRLISKIYETPKWDREKLCFIYDSELKSKKNIITFG